MAQPPRWDSSTMNAARKDDDDDIVSKIKRGVESKLETAGRLTGEGWPTEVDWSTVVVSVEDHPERGDLVIVVVYCCWK